MLQFFIIQVFNTQGQFKKEWKGIGYPYEIEAYDPNTLIITDARSREINKIDFDGKVIERFGQWGKKNLSLDFLMGWLLMLMALFLLERD